MRSILHILYRELVLCWNLERSHASIATGYGTYLYLAQTFASAPGTFGGMARFAKVVAPAADPEALWGAMMVIVGGATWLGIITGHVNLRRCVGLIRGLLWALMGGCFYASNPRSPACVLYGVLAWAAFTRAWNAHRITGGQSE